MSLNYNVNCDRNAWLCSIGASLSMSLAYLTAVEIVGYGLTVSTTQRSNSAVTISAEQLTQMQSAYTARFNEEFNAVLQHIQLPQDTYCFDCRRTSKYVTALP
jgi:hypothetical protein